MCTAALLMAATKVFMDPRIKKMSNMYTMEYYSDIKKEGNPVIWNNIDES